MDQDVDNKDKDRWGAGHDIIVDGDGDDNGDVVGDDDV